MSATIPKARRARRMFLVQWADGYSIFTQPQKARREVQRAIDNEGGQATVEPVIVLPASPEDIERLVEKAALALRKWEINRCGRPQLRAKILHPLIARAVVSAILGRRA